MTGDLPMRLLVASTSVWLMWRYGPGALAIIRTRTWNTDGAIFWFAFVGFSYQLAHAMGVTEGWRLALLVMTFVASLVAELAFRGRPRG